MNKTLLGYFTLLLIFSAFIGSRLIQIGFGDYHITPYRLACIIGLFLIPINKNTIPSRSMMSSYLFFLFIWILYSFVLLVVSTPDIKGYLETFFFLLCGTITTYYIGISSRDFGMFKRCFIAIELASVIPYVFAFYEILGGEYMFVSEENASHYSLDSAEISTLGVRVPISTFSNPNDFSFMILIVLVSSFMLFRITEKKIRFLHLLMFCVSLFLVFAAQSRAAVISVFVFGGITIIYKYLCYNRAKKLFFLIMLSLLFGGMYCFLNIFQDIFEPLLLVNLEGEGSDLTRSNLIRNGLVFLESSYYMGVGLGNIEYYMLHYPVFDTGEILNIHNWWMEILVSSGIIIFLWYVILFLRLLRETLRGIKSVQVSSNSFLFVMSFAFLIMFIIDSMSSSCLARTECSWVIMALMFMVPIFAQRRETEEINGEI